MAEHRRDEYGGQALAAVLSIEHGETDFDDYTRASRASGRFLHSAVRIPDGGSLGWQITAGDGGKTSCHAFAGPGLKVTEEDFNWIFHGFASADLVSPGSLESLFGEGRCVYRLVSVSGSPGDVSDIIEKKGRYYFSDDEESAFCLDHFRELYRMLLEADVVIRFLAGAANEGRSGHGMILVSLRGEMTLRMRASFSLAFPHLAVAGIRENAEPREGTELLPDEDFLAGMTRFMCIVMAGSKEKAGGEEAVQGSPETTAGELPEEEETEWEDADSVPIEKLEFSIRTYNCLNRGGIRTLADLLAKSEEDLMKIRSLGPKSRAEIRRKLAELPESVKAQKPKTPEDGKKQDHMETLGELIGLEGVKKQVRQIAAFARMKRDMAKGGRSCPLMTLNMEFVGNPGTGKTTVARILAEIFHELGLLESSSVVEVGRADLVGRYVGQTADRVKHIFEMAKGRLLFIDEAYSLVDEWEHSYGDEAINTIVQEMENNREDTIVIFAGYPDKMKGFFDRNPGLRSRVPFCIVFEDYSAGEMLQIAELEVGKRGFSVDPGAKERILAICGTAVGRPGDGNGRFCRNLVERAILAYASRVYGSGEEEPSPDFILREEDFQMPEKPRESVRESRIGFRP